MTASALWTSVVAAYDSDTLISLTNINAPEATAIVTATGEAAAQEVIDLWPVFAQVDYDASDATHVAVARRGVIAVLWDRGGTSTTIAEVKWEEVFGPDGTIARVRRTGPRGRPSPVTNSGVQQSEETSNGRTVMGWSDPDALPGGRNYLPLRRIAE